MANPRTPAQARCDLCGNPLPPRKKGQRGRPQLYCDKDTGRPCKEWQKRYEALRRMGETILEKSPSATRDKARFGLRRELQTAREELLAVQR